MIKWKDVTKETTEKVRKVVKRAVSEQTYKVDTLTLQMDLEAISLTVSMDWEKLLKASPRDFYHDLGGIQEHLNRKTGKLENCFLPRFAK